MIQCVSDGRIVSKEFRIVDGKIVREDGFIFGKASINFEEKPDACQHKLVFVGNYFSYGWYECTICGKKMR